jgi:stage III sporulation protein AG
VNSIIKYLDKLEEKPKKILILILIGVACIIVGSVFMDQREARTADMQSGGVINDTRRLKEEEIQKLEKRLEEILSKIKGAGNVRVMITGKSSSYFVMAQDEKADYKKESDGNQLSESSTTQKNHLMVKEGSNTQVPLVIKEYEPELEGVLVLCEGAEDPNVKLHVYNAVKSLMNVAPSKIEVSVYDTNQ